MVTWGIFTQRPARFHPVAKDHNLQGLEERRHRPMPLHPAKLALGAQQPGHAPTPPHVAVTHLVTRAVTRRITVRADSIGLVVARVRRNAPGTPSRTTVSVFSNPSRRLEAASALIRSSQRAVASRDALAAP